MDTPNYIKRQARKKARKREETKKRQNEEAVDLIFMAMAVREAKKAFQKGETPIGAVLVKNVADMDVTRLKTDAAYRKSFVVAKACNRRNTDKSTLSHAEILAIRKGTKYVNDWRLEGYTMYVTLEPCPMCAGALLQSRIDRVVIGAMNPKAGAAGSLVNLLDMPSMNHRAALTHGVREEECRALLQQFFALMRKRKKEAEDE